MAMSHLLDLGVPVETLAGQRNEVANFESIAAELRKLAGDADRVHDFLMQLARKKKNFGKRSVRELCDALGFPVTNRVHHCPFCKCHPGS